MTSIFSGIRPDTLKASLRASGLFGWYFTVMFICERSLHYYRDESLLTSVNFTFLISALISAALFAAVLLLFDFEGALNDKLLRWLPGLLMAESGIALSLATASTMTVLASVAGIAFGLGSLALLTNLLRVKVGQRLFAIGTGLAAAGLIRLLSTFIISFSSQTGLVIMSVAIGILAALTVHSNGYTKLGGPLISLAEAPPKKILSGIPPVYITLFLLSGGYYFIYNKISFDMNLKLLSSILSDDYVGYTAFVAAAAFIALFCHFRSTAALFAAGTTVTLASCALATLTNITEPEACFFSVFFMGAHAFIRISLLTAIIIFSLDRPHPLFYAMLGFAALIGGELAGTYAAMRYVCEVRVCMIVALVMLIFGSAAVSGALKKNGFTSEQLAHRSLMRSHLKDAASRYKLSEREAAILQLMVIDGSDIEETADKLMVSKNTVKAQTRTLLSKLGLSTADDAREYFSTLTSAAEAEQAEESLRLEKERQEMLKLRQELRDAELQRREEELVKKASEKAAEKAAQDSENSGEPNTQSPTDDESEAVATDGEIIIGDESDDDADSADDNDTGNFDGSSSEDEDGNSAEDVDDDNADDVEEDDITNDTETED